MISRTYLLIPAAAAALLLTACEGIGDGNRPESFFITGVSEDGGPFVTTECVRRNVGMIGVFTDGRQGDFTGRSTWSSDNPAVAMVSDGDVVLPGSGNAQLAKGTILPVAPGTATITAEFLGQTASLEVQVDALTGLRIEPAQSTTAIGATRNQDVFGLVDGEELLLDSFAQFTFDGDSEAIADVSANAGTITGLAAGTLTSRVLMDFCDEEVTADVEIAPVQTLTLSKEFDGTNELVVNTTELYTTTAEFANGDTQDLSFQVTLQSSNEDIALFNRAFGLTNALFGLAADPAPVQITARFDTTPEDEEDDAFVLSQAIDVTIVDATLDSLAITPDPLEIDGLGQGQLSVTGTYDGGTRTQSLDRHVLWVSNNADVFVSNQPDTPGRVTSFANEDASAEITVTRIEGDGDSATEFTDTATVNVTAVPDES